MSDADEQRVEFEQCAPDMLWFHPPDGGEVYVVRTSAGPVLVDSGWGKHRCELRASLAEAGIEPARFRLAFASHFHCDHVGDLGWWREQYDVPVVAHREAVEPMSRPDPIVTGACIPYANVDEPFVPCQIDHPVGGGDAFTIGDHTFRVESAPGHSIGGIHVVCGELIFVGDNLFESGGIGWMDIHWGSNPETYIETLEGLRAHCGKLACSGHGAPYVLREEIIDTAIETAAFYIPPDHGMGIPRPVSDG